MRAVWIVALLAHTANAQPPPDPYAPDPAQPPTKPENARGWQQEPEPEHVVVLGALGRGLQISGRFVVDVIAAPFRGIAWLEDHHHVLTRTRDLFYNEDHTAGILPSLSLETGFGGSVGASAFHKNLFGNGERISLSGSYGGADRYAAQLKFERRAKAIGTSLYFNSRARYEAANNLFFEGIGNVSDGGPFAANGETRFGEQRVLATESMGVQLGAKERQVRLGLTYIFNDRTLDQNVASTDTPIGDLYDVAMLEGFEGVRIHEATADAELDLQSPSRGLNTRLVGFAGGAFGDGYKFAHWGAEAALYWTPWRAGRTFVVRLANEGVQGDVPFTDLPRLGGSGLLRGYRRDQFRDETIAIATFEYQYPIQNSVSGTLFVETGKVGRTYDALASTKNLHTGYGGGLIVHTVESIVLTLQIAYGDGLQFYATTDVWQAFRKRSREL
ncbi:MAG: BamA/TamA family outer membrane protein [Kofleriaceae bacterium]